MLSNNLVSLMLKSGTVLIISFGRVLVFNCSLKRVSMGWWLLRLSAKILALLQLSVNFFQLRLTKKLKINFFFSKS